jgi:hypothetical protein
MSVAGHDAPEPLAIVAVERPHLGPLAQPQHVAQVVRTLALDAE